jgi:hypothetical protein
MRAAKARKYAEDHSGEPLRETRTVEITIRDSLRPLTVILVRRHEGDDGRWGRWRGIGKAPLGKHGLANLLAAYLE